MDLPEGQLQEMLDALDPSTRTLIAEVDLGGQANDFLRSDLGRHLVGCLKQEIVLAQDALSTTSPWRFLKVQELQNRIWRAKYMLVWLRELLVGGKSAQSALNEHDEGDGNG